MSETNHEDMEFPVPANMDQILRLADAELTNDLDVANQRPQRAPASAISSTRIRESHGDYPDLKECLDILQHTVGNSSTHALTHMDAAFHLSPTCVDKVESVAGFIERAVSIVRNPQHGFWYGPGRLELILTGQLENDLRNCISYLFMERILFYDARRRGISLAEYCQTISYINLHATSARRSAFL
ncbi:hypothetical protein CC86DRAFT_22782 [Ophiobolus disseminans]|uniref:Uncharacterized protein n=1 Tax=Ophiobolus disseminans TaxID=1469910 RepID=A0A6A7A1H2_9PLEO|nr:hypothetical protein CC86DRAFT_22782 [Ophiobolus disseminans]